MKKKIAVFANGWSDEYLDFALKGIQKRAEEDNIDVFIFLIYPTYEMEERTLKAELNILNLPQLQKFDGVLLLGNTLTVGGELGILREKIEDAKVPAVCLEYEVDGIDCIRTENTNGMIELMEHMITVHGVKDIYWVGGPRDNPESQIRYQAVIDTMEKHGLKVDPDRYLDGQWSYYTVQGLMAELIPKLDKLPDAFICANDVMAMGVCLALEKAGIKVPEDVKVTGFDNLPSGNYFSPILSSVDRGWKERSYQATEYLIELMKGKPGVKDTVYNSHFFAGESCGCSVDEERLKIQRDACRKTYSVPIERTIFDWHLVDIDDSVAGVGETDDLHESFAKLWESKHDYEGDEFYICLDQAFIDSIEQDSQRRTVGYSKNVDLIYGMKNGKTIPRRTIPTKDMVPEYDPDSDKTAVYLLAPLHRSGYCAGYLVFKNNYKLIKDYYLNSFIRHIASGLSRGRQNIRLEILNKVLNDISVRDELSGLYNRMGYEKIAIPYLDSLRSEKKKSVIMVVDINLMKEINDKYGHLQGDMAIKIVANAIKESIPEGWKAVRYGGDEFVIIGEYGLSENMEAIKEDINSYIHHYCKELSLPFSVSVSIGYVVISPDNDLRNEEYFRMADEAMYEMKQNLHKKDKE
ncbi:MAG: GGDEF domain-containing protein [Eubacterium sp.]|nr:GGDEF domain-containing protein [Eubacterium sp.]